MSLLARMQAEVWGLEPTVLDSLLQIVVRHDMHVKLTPEEVQAATGRKGGPQDENGYRVENGVGIVPISGVIAKYSSQVNDISQPQGTSCDAILQGMRAALADPSVHAIMLQIESPGGAVAGVADTAAIIKAADAVKPVVAFIDDMGASAAYWLGVGARTVYATATAVVGSIGVLGVMVDSSKQASERGLVVHKIASGPEKGAGIPGTAISEADRAAAKQRIDYLASMFFATVQSGREMDATELAAVTTGGVWIGAQAKEKGLIDGVRTYDQVMSELAAMHPRLSTQSTTARPRATFGVSMKTAPLNSVDPEALHAEGEKAGETAALSRLEALEAAFPNDSAFAMKSFKAGHSVEKAKGEYSAVLQQKLDAEVAAHVVTKASLVTVTAERDTAKTELTAIKGDKPSGAKALPTEKTDASTSVDAKDPRLVAYDAKYAELKKNGDKAPSRAIAHNFPEIHKGMLDAENGK